MDLLTPYLTLPLRGETWSTPALAPGLVVAADRSGAVHAFDPAGALRWRFEAGAEITASPTLATIGGEETVLIGDHAGTLHALRLSDGTVRWSQKCGAAIRASAAVADGDGDGIPEVYVGAYGPWLLCLEAETGAVRWRRYLPKHELYGGTKAGIVSSPLVADVDGDGEMEVCLGMRSARAYCCSAVTGRLKWFRAFRYDPDSSPSLAVVDGEPLLFIGGGEHTSGAGDCALFALRPSDGAVVWKSEVGGGIDSSPTVADLDGDGRLEVVACTLADASCYAFDAATGAVRWRHAFGPTDACTHADGTCRPSPETPYFTGRAICRSYTSPLVADLDADGQLEVVVGSNNGALVVLDGATGAERERMEAGGLVRGSPVLADLDDDGRHELVVPAADRLLLFRTEATGAAWPQFKGRADHLGVLDPMRVPSGLHLPRQRLRHLRLAWDWLAVDAARFIAFQLDRRLGVRFAEYYY